MAKDRRDYNRAYYLANKERLSARHKAYREAHRAENIAYQRAYYKRMMSNPELYADSFAKRQAYHAERRDAHNAWMKAWRRRHRGKVARYERWRRDRMRHLCRIDEGYYAALRRRKRELYAMKRKNYKPRMSIRIPDYCRFDAVLDKRSVYLWNNHMADSLRANRAFKNELMEHRWGDRCGAW